MNRLRAVEFIHAVRHVYNASRWARLPDRDPEMSIGRKVVIFVICRDPHST